MEGGDYSLVFSGKNCCLSSLCQRTVNGEATNPVLPSMWVFFWLTFSLTHCKPSQ